MTTTDDRPTEDTPTVVLDQRTAGFVLAVLQTVRDDSKTTYDAALRIAAEDYYVKGDRLTVTDPTTGTKLGTVGMSDPEPKANVIDEAALFAHIADHHPDAITETDSGFVLDPNREAETIAVLVEHAPHLLVRHVGVRVDDVALNAALALALETDDDGERRKVPGVSVSTPAGVVSTRLTKAGKAAVRAAVAAGRIDALRALPPKPRPDLFEPGTPEEIADAEAIAEGLTS